MRPSSRVATEVARGAREVAILLAIADFALTASGSAEPLPLQAPVMPQALAPLLPLLVKIGAAPAYRIHHASVHESTNRCEPENTKPAIAGLS